MGAQAAEMLIWSVAPKMPEEIPRLASLLPPVEALRFDA